MNCKHNKKMIVGKCYSNDGREFDFGISLEENMEYTEFKIKEMVDNYMLEMEQDLDIIIEGKSYSVKCSKCHEEIEI